MRRRLVLDGHRDVERDLYVSLYAAHHTQIETGVECKAVPDGHAIVRPYAHDQRDQHLPRIEAADAKSHLMSERFKSFSRKEKGDAALQASEARFRTLVETAPALIFATDSAGRNSFVNERYQNYTGLSFEALCGDGWRDVVHPDDREAAIAENIASQTLRGPLERRLRIRRHDGAWRWFLSRTEPVAGAAADATFAWLGISIDIDEQVHAEERERLLTQEVDHRAKNLLAIVQSIIDLTHADDVNVFKRAMNGRIEALARSNSLLAARRWDGVELKALVDEELAAFCGRDGALLAVNGPSIRLNPVNAQSLGLVLHELATNAAKHGSLSVESGCLLVSWTVTRNGERPGLKLLWQESGGPRVVRPSRRGFGSTLIRTSVEQQLKGRVKMVWKASGLTCEITLPGEQISYGRPSDARKAPLSPASLAAPELRGTPVLVLEDEPLIAMQIGQALSTAGCAVLGPASTLGEAVDLIVTSGPAAAFLDVNLSGDMSFPIADILLAKDIPFAFCTGYSGAADLPSRFEHIAVITKPFSEAVLVQALAELIGTQ